MIDFEALLAPDTRPLYQWEVSDRPNRFIFRTPLGQLRLVKDSESGQWLMSVPGDSADSRQFSGELTLAQAQRHVITTFKIVLAGIQEAIASAYERIAQTY